MLIVNTSVSGAFSQLHHSPFLTNRITFADVHPAPHKNLNPLADDGRRYSLHSSYVQDFPPPFLTPHYLNYVAEQSSLPV